MTAAPAAADRGRLSAAAPAVALRPPLPRALALTFTGALLATLAQLAVPLVTAAVVDGPIADGDRAGLVPLLGLALVFGIAEAALFFLRRWAMNMSCLQIERDLRDTLYQRLQRLPVAFHDRWPSGQLLSRATTDVSTIRRFVGFGAVFLVVNLITCVVVAARCCWSPTGRWALAVLVTTVPLSCSGCAGSGGTTSSPARVQDEQGELATDVEEAVQGIRVVKSLGRSGLVFGRYDAQGPAAARPGAGQGPHPGAALVRLRAPPAGHPRGHPGRRRAGRDTGALTVGGLVGFVALFTVLLWPILSLGFLFAFAQETASACDRIGELLDAPITVTDRPGVAPAAARLPRPAALRGRRLPLSPARAPPCSTASTSTSPPARRSPWSGPPGSGKTTLTALVGRLYDVTGGRVTLDGVDVRDLPLDQLRSVVATAFEDATLFSMSVRENLTLGRPGRHRRRRRGGAAGRPGGVRARPAVGPGHPHRRAGPVAVRRAAAAAGAGPRRARPARRCSCSTTRCRRSTCTPRRWSRRRCATCWPRPRRWSWRTAPRRCCSPTGSRCWPTAGSPPSARTPTCWPRCPPTATCCAQDSELAEALP